MGVAYKREWDDIVIELAEVVYNIPGFLDFVELSKADWDAIPKPEQLALLQTMCDDILFGLGEEPVCQIGRGRLEYKADAHCVEAWDGIKFLKRIELV